MFPYTHRIIKIINKSIKKIISRYFNPIFTFNNSLYYRNDEELSIRDNNLLSFCQYNLTISSLEIVRGGVMRMARGSKSNQKRIKSKLQLKIKGYANPNNDGNHHLSGGM